MIRASEGGQVISGSHVRMSEQAIVVSDKGPEGAPAVSFRRDGDLITEIQIRCGCGAHIVLDCQYDTERSVGPRGRVAGTPAPGS